MITSDTLVAEARSLVLAKVPYRHQGRSVNGLDCLGLILFILEKHHAVPDNFERRNYGRLPMGELLEKMSMYCIKIDEPVEGCALLIRFSGQARPSHAAIYTGASIIHSYGVLKRVVEHSYRSPWPEITDSFWKLPGVVYE